MPTLPIAPRPRARRRAATPSRSAHVGALLAGAGAAALLPAAARAQDSTARPAPTTIEACYVPASGTMYRVRAPGAPAACTQPSHVAFRWPAAAPASPAAVGDAAPVKGGPLLSPTDDPRYLLSNGVRASAAGFAALSPLAADATPVLTTTPPSHYGLLWHGPKGALRVGVSTGQAWSASNLGTASFAYGLNSTASGPQSMAGGNGSRATARDAVALGSNTRAESYEAVALGGEARALGGSSLALGDGPLAEGFSSVAVGSDATARASWSYAIGRSAEATGTSALALGTNARARGEGAVVLSSGAGPATDDNQNALATGAQAMAIGRALLAMGDHSVAMGRFATTSHTGAFVLNTRAGAVLTSAAAEQFSARFVGGYRLFTNAANTTGCAIAAGGGSWSCTSDRATKTALRPVNGDALLAKLRTLPIGTWEYKSERGARHLGPMAQDFRAAFGLGADDKSIALLDASGVALAAVQALEARTHALQAENAALARRNDALAARLAAMERTVATLASYGAPHGAPRLARHVHRR
mgnify:FL=1